MSLPVQKDDAIAGGRKADTHFRLRRIREPGYLESMGLDEVGVLGIVGFQ